jgi:glycosyltransferase involved in cell wall biosynthesis
MRILFVLPRMVTGGVERVTLHLITKLKNEGHFCLLALGSCRGELAEEAEALVDVRELAGNGLWRFIPRLTKIIREWQPTHIITAFADVALLAWVARWSARSNAALVHGVHGTPVRDMSRPALQSFLRHRCDKAMAMYVCRHADLVIAVSQGLGREVHLDYRVPVGRIRTIYNPVIPDVGQFVDSQRRVNNGGNTRIVALGRLAWEKGFDVLVRAMTHIPRSLSWTLDIYGEGAERPSLEALITSCDLYDRIRLRGYTADPFDVLHDAELFVLPSRHEGLGNVLVEAMACGAQIVASDCRHGPREILEGGKLGQLVPVEDPGALASAITKVLTGEKRYDPRQLMLRARMFTVSASYTLWREALLDVERNTSR